MLFHTLCTLIPILRSSIGKVRSRRVWLDLPISVGVSSYLFYVALSCPRGALSRYRCRTSGFCCSRHFDVPRLEPLGKKLWHQYLAGMRGVSMGGSHKKIRPGR